GTNITLVGGQRYYLEAVWREGTGGDGVTVAVRAQADTSAVPTTELIPATMLQFPTNLDRIWPVNFSQAGSGSGIIPASPTVNEGQTVTFFPKGLSGSPAYSTPNWFKNGQAVYVGQNFYVTQPLTFAD